MEGFWIGVGILLALVMVPILAVVAIGTAVELVKIAVEEWKTIFFVAVAMGFLMLVVAYSWRF